MIIIIKVSSKFAKDRENNVHCRKTSIRRDGQLTSPMVARSLWDIAQMRRSESNLDDLNWTQVNNERLCEQGF